MGRSARRSLLQTFIAMATPPIVGKEVDSWCTKCKLVLGHTIEAVVNGRITKVHCNTCKGQHAYRARAPGTGTGTGSRPRASRATGSRAAPAAVVYADLLRGRDAGAAREYGSGERFAPKELIKHTTFGLGVVTALKDVNKIEVLFPDGAKTLIHRRG
jgi:hypothetical protein